MSIERRATPRSIREDELVRQHLGLVGSAVHSIISRLPRHVDRDELTSAGMGALAQAARTYDESRETGFERFAMARIRGALLDELRQRDWASRSVRTRGRRLLGAVEDLTSRLGRSPTTAELAEHLGVTPSAVDAMNNDVERARLVSYDSLAGGAPRLSVHSEALDPEMVLVERERQAYLVDAVAALPKRMRQVVVSYFLEERPSQEIAQDMGISTSRVSQIRTEALALLRDGMLANLSPSQPASSTSAAISLVARRKAAYASAVAVRSNFKARLSAPVSARSLAGALG